MYSPAVSDRSARADQPGLEALEYAHAANGRYMQVLQPPALGHIVSPASDKEHHSWATTSAFDHDSPPQQQNRPKRWIVIVVVVALVSLALGGVIGGIAGWQITLNNSRASSSPPPPTNAGGSTENGGEDSRSGTGSSSSSSTTTALATTNTNTNNTPTQTGPAPGTTATAFPQGLVVATVYMVNSTTHMVPFDGSSNGIFIYNDGTKKYARRSYLSDSEAAADAASMHTPISNPAAAPVLKKRERTDCWNSVLDKVDIDAAVSCLRTAIASGYTITTAGSQQRFLGCIQGDVIVTFCVNVGRSTRAASPEKLDQGMAALDAKCGTTGPGWSSADAYESVVEIYGRSWSGTRVCLGP